MSLPITDFIIERLLEFDPNYDVGSGTPTTGLLVEPLAVILQPVSDEIAVLQATQSILTILESSDPDAFPEDIVDELAANAFVERDPGKIGSTVERMRFFEPQAFSAQKGVLVFRGPNSQRYTNSEAIAITKAEMALNQDGSLYFTDFPIIALEEGSTFNTDPGTITIMEAEPAGVANVTNLFIVDQGVNRETNTELIDRIKVAVTVRALVTGRGIIVTLTENFTSIVEVQPIGFGDPEMMRDIVYNVHIGGNVDVYVRASTFLEETFDAIGLEVDTSRRVAGQSVLSIPDAGGSAPFTGSLAHSSIDRTNVAPVVASIDNVVVFVEGTDYTLDDVSGELTRIASPAGHIYQRTSTGGVITDSKTLAATGQFANVRPGMILTVSAPFTGRYTVKEQLGVDTIKIYGNFPGASFTGVNFEVNENLSITYEYNPVSIDVRATARATDRVPFTITQVPLMLLTLLEVLDPLSGEPTGVTLSGAGGYGAGGYGAGGYGIGTGAQYRLVVTSSTARFSVREDNFIELDQVLAGSSIRVHFLYSGAIAAIQAFVDDRNNGTEAASLLVRQLVPVFVESQKDIGYDIPAATVASAPTEAQMTTLVQTFIDDVGDATLELSDIVDLMYNNGASEVDLDGLDSLRGAIHNEDGSVVFILPSARGTMAVPSDPIPDPSEKPLSPRIARFVTRSVVLKRNVV